MFTLFVLYSLFRGAMNRKFEFDTKISLKARDKWEASTICYLQTNRAYQELTVFLQSLSKHARHTEADRSLPRFYRRQMLPFHWRLRLCSTNFTTVMMIWSRAGFSDMVGFFTRCHQDIVAAILTSPSVPTGILKFGSQQQHLIDLSYNRDITLKNVIQEEKTKFLLWM